MDYKCCSTSPTNKSTNKCAERNQNLWSVDNDAREENIHDMEPNTPDIQINLVNQHINFFIIPNQSNQNYLGFRREIN